MLFVLACGPGAPARAPARSRALTPPNRAAFVLYTREQTIILATSGENPVIGPGQWILDDRRTTRVLRHYVTLTQDDLSRIDAPQCACEGEDGSCRAGSVVLRELDPRTLAEVTNELTRGCSCVVGDHTLSQAAEEAQAQAREAEWNARYPQPSSDEEDEAEADEDCEEQGASEIASLVGGVLYEMGWTWNGGCEGASVYDAISSPFPLIDDPPESIPMPDDAFLGCREGGGPGDLNRLWPLEPSRFTCRGERGQQGEDNEECGYCDSYSPEAEAYVLRSGYLWLIEDNVFHAGAMRWISRTPARRTSCPSSADPCGDPNVFPPLQEEGRDGLEFWVASDDRAALRAIAHRYELFRPREHTPHATLTLDADVTDDVIGVRYHADVSLLVRALERWRERPIVTRAETSAEATSCRLDEDCGSDRLCDGGTCRTRCERDSECQARGACGAFCASDGRCRFGCDSRHRCPDGQLCRAFACEPRSLLHREDAEFRDSRRGSGWGDRCYRHIERDTLWAAQAACERGLQIATEPRVRGALLFNLGLIAERRGEIARAREHYTSSLSERRDNATVRRHLEALPPNP